MTIRKALPYVLNVVILTLVLLMPFAQSSSSSRLNGINMAGSRPITATSKEVARFRNEGAASVGTVEESARRVPTGPDPLHHNNHPIRP